MDRKNEQEAGYQRDIRAAAVQWFGTAKAGERINFINDVIGCLPMEQLVTVHNNVTKAKRKWKQIEPEFRKKAKISRPLPDPTATATGPIPTGLVPPVVVAAEAPEPWWHAWKPSNVVAIDCEMVHLLKTFKPEWSGEERVKAATVSIVKFNKQANKYEEIYAAKVQWPAFSYKVNWHTRRINGFEANSLVDGKPFDIVVEEVRQVLKDKLVISCNGSSDFRSLGIKEYGQEFDVFDLHSHFQKPTQSLTSGGFIDETVTQPIGLRSLYFHFFKVDIQSYRHSAKVDAEATLKIFMEVYTKTEKKTNVSSQDNDDLIDTV